MVSDIGGIVENRWFEVREEDTVAISDLEFPQIMYHRGHPHKKLRVSTSYRFFDRTMKVSVAEFGSDQVAYEVKYSFKPRPIDSQGTAIKLHTREVNRLIANYRGQLARGELPIKN